MTEFKSHNKHYKYKIPVIGDPAVGKTSLIQKYTKGSFQNDYLPTIGAQFSKYEEDIEGDRISLFLWDIAGQDTYHFLRPAFYEGSKGAIVVYSLE
ncbi:MAG: Rab family GTPase, partial [Promethearchaeota archaeon]